MTGGNDRRHTGILSYLAGSNNSLVLSGTATHLRGVLCFLCCWSHDAAQNLQHARQRVEAKTSCQNKFTIFTRDLAP